MPSDHDHCEVVVLFGIVMHYLVFHILFLELNGSTIAHSYCNNELFCEVSDELQVIQQTGHRE